MHDKFDGSTSKFANFIKSILHQNFDKEMELARYELLKEVHPDKKAIKKIGKLTSFYCGISIGGFFTSMHTSNADVMSSRKRTEKCSTCGYEDTTDSPFVNHPILGWAIGTQRIIAVPDRDAVLFFDN